MAADSIAHWPAAGRSVLENLRQVKFPHNSLMTSHLTVPQDLTQVNHLDTQATYQVEEVITKAVFLGGGF